MVRNIVRLVDFIGIYLVGLIIILFDKKNQRLGDLCAKAYVIQSTNIDKDLKAS